MAYIEVSIAAPFTGRKFYTYESVNIIDIGTIVQIPFGTKKSLGIVRNIVKKPTFKTKPIQQITPLIVSAKSLQLLRWMEHFYPYDFGEITNLFIPQNALTKSRSASSVRPKVTATIQPKLTKDQTEALQIIQSNQHVLLHGDTGTGKTRVYLDYANSVLAQGKSVLILTPEIGLTPQLKQTIAAACPYPLHVVHSQNTPAYRKLIWQTAAANTEPAVFVGPRSSLFLPYQNLGLVVIDEAHDNSYKSMQSPKYNAVYVAAQLAKVHKAHFIQSTATPNVADYAAIQNHQVPIARMTTIAVGPIKASGQVIDLRDKQLFTKHRLIADELLRAIEDALQNGEQTMLFINRRGSARIVQCNACGHIRACPTCGLPLTYHHDTHKMSCHICNQTYHATSQCAACGSADLLYFSPGTKGLEQEIQSLFPKARVIRFDLDVSAKDTIQRKLSGLQTGAYDIIIGTQLISKGFNLPHLSVVGVLNADSGFSIPDFRAEEITFQQIYQVTGRVGRGHTLSKFFIQTRQPTHPVIEAALHRNWQDFYDYELHKRKLFTYPPFAYLAVLSITKKTKATAQKIAQKTYDLLNNSSQLELLGPTPSYHETSHGGYTWQILAKSTSRATLVAALVSLPSEWSIDIDPTSVL